MREGALQEGGVFTGKAVLSVSILQSILTWLSLWKDVQCIETGTSKS